LNWRFHAVDTMMDEGSVYTRGGLRMDTWLFVTCPLPPTHTSISLGTACVLTDKSLVDPTPQCPPRSTRDCSGHELSLGICSLSGDVLNGTVGTAASCRLDDAVVADLVPLESTRLPSPWRTNPGPFPVGNWDRR
jgi:hypothetical protein